MILLALVIRLFPVHLVAFEWRVSDDIRQRIESIPTADRKEIEQLFRLLIQHMQFGHVFFGEKPAATELSIVGRSYQDPWLPSIGYRLLDAHWSAWERHRELFPSSRFVFDRVECTVFDGSLAREYWVIDRTQVRKLSNQHAPLFRQVFECDDPELVLERLEKEGIQDVCLDQASFGRHRVTGILLGFGLHNSTLFDRGCSMRKALLKNCSVPVRPVPVLKQAWSECSGLFRLRFPESHPVEAETQAVSAGQLSMIADSYQRCWDQLGDCLPSLVVDNPLSPVELPVCRVDASHKETKVLLRSYEKSRGELSELLRREDFLEILLTRICEQ